MVSGIAARVLTNAQYNMLQNGIHNARGAVQLIAVEVQSMGSGLSAQQQKFASELASFFGTGSGWSGPGSPAESGNYNGEGGFFPKYY